jgi:hypothetical protein
MKRKEDQIVLPNGTKLRLPQPIIVNGILTWNVTWQGKRRHCFGNATKRESHTKFLQFRIEYIQARIAACTPDSLNGGVSASTVTFNTACNAPAKTDIPAYQVGDVLSAFLDYAKQSFPAEQYVHFRLSAKWILESGYGTMYQVSTRLGST